MGCGMSKYGLADQATSCSFHPSRRKLEELRCRNDCITTDGNMEYSTKLLLKEEGCLDQDYVVIYSNGRRSISSPTVTNLDSGNEPITGQRRSTKMVDCDDPIYGKVGVGGDQNGVTGRIEVERKNLKEAVAMERFDDEEDDERRISNYDGSLRIGSPSFREYCIIDCVSEKNEGNSDGEKRERNTKGDKCNGPPCSNEGSSTKSSQKGRKRRRFRKVFPTGRQSNSTKS